MNQNIVIGRNPLLEVLESEVELEKIYMEKGNRQGSAKKIFALARDKRILVTEVNKDFLDEISEGANHQGVAGVLASYHYFDYDGIFKRLEERGESPFFVVLDQIQDPHNFGAILRSCEGSGVNGVFIPMRRSVGVTPVVHKVSAGATNYVPVAKVKNISDTINRLKKDGIWVYGAAGEGAQNLYQTDLKGKIAIVIGNEGYGLGERVRKCCDGLISIPMKGKLDSLNASNATAVILYEVVRQNETD